MASLVEQFQSAIVVENRTPSELLRMAKLIASKLNLPQLECWIEHELTGYPDGVEVPDYRRVGADIQVQLTAGWTYAFRSRSKFPFTESVTSAMTFSLSDGGAFTIAKNFRLEAVDGRDMERYQKLPQRAVVDAVAFKNVVDAVKNRLLDWAIALEKQGVTGEGMSFNEREKLAAQNISIQNFNGVLGNVTGSTVNVYDFSQVRQVLSQAGVSQAMRNELESLMEAVEGARDEDKPSAMARISKWVLDNAEKLGDAAIALNKVLGG